MCPSLSGDRFWVGGGGGGLCSNLSGDSGVDICVLVFQVTGSDCWGQVLVSGVFQVIGIGLVGRYYRG